MENPLFCKVCLKLCNSHDQYSEHIRSPSHLAKEQKAKEFARSGSNFLPVQGKSGIQQQECNPSFNTFPAANQGNFNGSQSGSSLLQSFMTDGGRNSQPYVMNNSRGFCYVCQLDLTSPQHCDQHIKGKNHTKKLQQWRGNTGQLAQPVSADNDGRLFLQSSATQSQVPKSDNRSEAGVRDFSADGNIGVKLQSPGAANYSAPQLNNNATLRGSTISGVLQCKVCKVPLSGEQNAREHFAGKKHKKEMLMLSFQKREEGPQNFSNDPDQTQVLKPFSRPQTSNLTSGRSISDHPSVTSDAQTLSNNFSSATETVDDASVDVRANDSSISSTMEVNQKSCTLSDNLRQNYGDKSSLELKRFDEMSKESLSSLSDNMLQPLSSLSDNMLQPLNPYVSGNVSEVLKPIMMQPSPVNQTFQRIVSSPSVSAGPNLASEPTQSAFDDSYEFDGNRGCCKVCDIELTSPSHAQQHLNGEKHRKKVERLLQSPMAIGRNVQEEISRGDNNIPGDIRNPQYELRASDISESSMMQPSPVNQTSQRNVLSPSVSAGPSLAFEPTQSAFDDSYEFDGNRGCCKVCDIELTSPSHAQQHLNGEKHRKKVERLLQSPLTVGRNVQEEISRGDNNIPVVRQNPQCEPRAPDISENFYYFSGTTGFCEACKCILSSKEQALEHLKGRPHERNVDIMRLSRQGKTPSLHCEACRRTFTGEVPANQHLSSVKHKLIVRLLASGAEPIPGVENAFKMRDEDGSVWIFCDICRKPLNTVQQLMIHQGTPGHLMEREKYLKSLNPPASPQAVGDPLGLHGSVSAGNPLAYAENVPQTSAAVKPRGAIDMSENQKGLLTYATKPKANVGHFPSYKGAPSPGMTSSPQVYQPFQYSPATGSCSNNNNANVNASANCGVNNGDHDGEHSSPSSANLSHHHPTRQTSPPGSDRGGSQSEEGGNSDRNRFSNHDAHGEDPLDFMRRPTASNTARGGDCFRNINMDAQSSPEDLQDDIEEKPRANQNISIAEDFPGRPASFQPTPRQEEPFRVTRNSAFPHVCELCNVPMNTRESYEAHLKGKRHRWNATYAKAEAVVLGVVNKMMDVADEVLYTRAYDVSETGPRPYQVDLMTKTMSQDCVIYLPTGTGKTLVSVLTMGLMLEENYDRPVIFLVDKILLVIQQGKYIQKELKASKKEYERYSLDNRGMKVKRHLNMAFVCGGMSHSQGIPLWKHDVIVTTAAYCINLLEKGVIRWDHFSLAVLDEVHHCIKSHPYKRLITSFHHRITDPARRPKILGLTASPAGKDTVEKTFHMLNKLLETLGNARIAIPEGKNCDELKRYQSDPQLHSVCVPLTSVEEEFQLICYRYFLQCYCQLAQMSSILSENEDSMMIAFNHLMRNFSEEVLTRLAQGLIKDPEPFDYVIPLIFGAKCTRVQRSDDEIFEKLKIHTVSFYLNLSSIATGMNFDEMEKIFDDDKEIDQLEAIKDLEIPFDAMRQHIQTFKAQENTTDTPMLQKLFQILQNAAIIDWQKEDSMALVLVQERKEAKSICRTLKQKDFVRTGGLRVAHLVGHGKGNSDKGMDVKKQKKVLENQTSLHILLATSIAEEGVDIGKLGLVVSMNPPSTVRALVQMRGRARKKDSHFFILCGSEEAKDKVDRLLRQENNMLEAAKLCVAEERRGERR